MTVGVFSVACTGDDGAQGPPGPAGEQGPPGESGSGAEESEDTNFYDFLKTWGSDSGQIACSDPLLEGMGVFPGPAELDPRVVNDVPTPATLVAQCGAALFSAITPASLKIPGIIGTGEADLIFIKTGVAEESNADNPEVVDSTETSRAKTVTTDKTFAGGTIHAEMNTTGGADEPFERASLYSDCGVGTPPSTLAGTWRAVRIVKTSVEYDAVTKEKLDGLDEEGTEDSTEADTTSESTTLKVCVRLDSVPGTVKCFVDIDGDQQIATYDSTAEPGKELTNVAGGKGSLGPLDSDGTTDDANGNTGVQNFFDLDPAPTSSDAIVPKLCNLFEEGLE